MSIYTHTKQAEPVAEAMAEVLRGHGCDVSIAAIEFTNPRYLESRLAEAQAGMGG